MRFWSFHRNFSIGWPRIAFENYHFDTEDPAIIKQLMNSPSRGETFDKENDDGTLPAILGPGFLRVNHMPMLDVQQARHNRDKQVMAEKANMPSAQVPQSEVENPEQRLERELQAAREKQAASDEDTYEYGINRRPWKDPAKAEVWMLGRFRKDGIRREVIPNPKGKGYCIRKIRE